EAKALCICPAGHKLYHSGKHLLFNGYRVAHFKAPITACRNCPLRAQCLRHPERTVQRSISIIKGREGTRSSDKRSGAIERMRWKFDTPRGREIYSRRMGTVEPVFANLQNKGMRRFTLRGRKKVDAQWQLFTMVHNIEKIARRRRAN
ncbi:MAG TPA: transposase, partial [Polyangiales bacterium]